MCCTLEPARLSNTILYAAEVMHPTLNRIVHVLGYANNAESIRPNAWWVDPTKRGAPVPNAMLLPIPSTVPMGPENVIDTTKTKGILKDMAEAIRPQMYSFAEMADEAELFGDSRSIQIFDAGSYTVVLAKNASDIPSVLNFVPVEKRPRVNQAIFDRYAELYPNAQFALCCWSGKIDGDTVEPLLWWYEPSNASSLFLPALDAHDGRPPVLGAEVEVDHTLVVGTNVRPMSGGAKPYYTDDISSVQPFLPTKVAGTELQGSLPNGDWRFRVDNFKKLEPFANDDLFERVSPPAA